MTSWKAGYGVRVSRRGVSRRKAGAYVVKQYTLRFCFVP